MKYIKIDFDRVVELFRSGRKELVFTKMYDGELGRVDSVRKSLTYFIEDNDYFEYVEK